VLARLLVLFTEQLQCLRDHFLCLLHRAGLDCRAEPLHHLGDRRDVLAAALHLLRTLLNALDLGGQLRRETGGPPDFGPLQGIFELLDGTAIAIAYERFHRIDDLVVAPVAGNGDPPGRKGIRLEVVPDQRVFRVDDLAEALRLKRLVEDCAGRLAISLQEHRIGNDAFEQGIGGTRRRHQAACQSS